MELTLDQALHKAVEMHKAGHLQEADRLYTAILQVQPEHADANHNLGVLAVDLGKIQEALPFFEAALTTNDRIPQYWLSHIDALLSLGRISEARHLFEQAKKSVAIGKDFDRLSQLLYENKSKSNYVKKQSESTNATGPSESRPLSTIEPPRLELESLIHQFNQNEFESVISSASKLIRKYPSSVTLHNICGASHASLRQFESAIASFSEALKIDPDFADAHNNIGNSLKERGELDAAIQSYKRALNCKPDFIQALQNLGITFKARGELDSAIDSFEKILKISPNNSEAYINLGASFYDKGDLRAAKYNYKQALKFNPNYAEAYFNMGIALRNEGNLDSAIESFYKSLELNAGLASAHYNVGLTLQAQGKLTEAIDSFNMCLSIEPDYPEAYNNIGSILQGCGDLDAAEGSFRKAIKVRPEFAEAHVNLGNVLNDLGKKKQAVASYKQALTMRPGFVEAYFNLGNALREMGELEAAVNSYQDALNLRPGFVQASFNLGNALQELGKFEQAISSYKNALRTESNYAEALLNMGLALKHMGQIVQAIDSFTRAIKVNPDLTEAYVNLGSVLKGVEFSRPVPGLPQIILSLLNQNNRVRPIDISRAGISLLKLDPEISRVFEKYSAGSTCDSVLEIIKSLAKNSLLLRLMSVCPLPDFELEDLLTNIRSSLLFSIFTNPSSPELLCFQSALALQCFTNEYIYSQTVEEIRAVDALESTIEEIIATGQQPTTSSILCLASYKALHNCEWAPLLVDTDEISSVYTRQFREPAKEELLRHEIPVLEEITDDISSKVREQYEENPFPRWVNLGLHLAPVSIAEKVIESQLNIVDSGILDVQCPSILVAGCGTGQHSIGTATTFKKGNVLAIDLSLSSLAYAKRKTEDLRLANIDYMQADILDLGKLNRQFDVVESVGVIHHMDDPMAGWRVLVDCLKPGGLMKIGLYSELARQPIVRMRQEVIKAGLNANDDDMRSFRRAIAKSRSAHHIWALNSSDFYSLSELRDLIFHVQEHRFTLPEIERNLKALGLRFSGFDSQSIVSAFRQENTVRDDTMNLDKWSKFEEAHPSTFVGMYQFWCQKCV